MVISQADRIRALAQKPKEDFAKEVSTFNGSREVFILMITFAINNHDIEPSAIAIACGVREKTVFGWTHGSAPENEKTRRAIISKLAKLLLK